MISLLLALLAFISLATTAWQWLAARRFPLHRRVSDRGYTPAVTVLKPLKGTDAETGHCLESWLAQDYPSAVQILFGVPTAEDPVCDTVRRLIAAHPGQDAELVVCGDLLGTNGKVSTIIQLHRRARHDVIVVSDADVHVPPDFLANIVAPLRDRAVGLVNCFYRLANPATLAMQWEAVAINADFWSQVLQAQSLRSIDFALGAAMATTRAQLDSIGGFAKLADHLADDYQLGNLIVQRGGRILISPVVVDCWETPKTWRQVWFHQLRWARTIRVCRPVGFFFSILSNATLWPLLMLLVRTPGRELGWGTRFESAFSLGRVSLIDTTVPVAIPWIFATFMVCLLVRILTALSNRARLEQTGPRLACLWLVPIKDLLSAAIWALALLGNRIAWRGHKYRITPAGKLVEIRTQPSPAKPVASRGV
jgi:ceramide glucosyltransferase